MPVGGKLVLKGKEIVACCCSSHATGALVTCRVGLVWAGGETLKGVEKKKKKKKVVKEGAPEHNAEDQALAAEGAGAGEGAAVASGECACEVAH